MDDLLNDSLAERFAVPSVLGIELVKLDQDPSDPDLPEQYLLLDADDQGYLRPAWSAAVRNLEHR